MSHNTSGDTYAYRSLRRTSLNNLSFFKAHFGSDRRAECLMTFIGYRAKYAPHLVRPCRRAFSLARLEKIVCRELDRAMF